MQTIKLGQGNKVDEVLTSEDFSSLVNSLVPTETYAVFHEKELIDSIERGDLVNVLLEDNAKITMEYTSYVEYLHEAKELMVFTGEGKELNIFYSFNSDEVFGGISELEPTHSTENKVD